MVEPARTCALAAKFGTKTISTRPIVPRGNIRLAKKSEALKSVNILARPGPRAHLDGAESPDHLSVRRAERNSAVGTNSVLDKCRVMLKQRFLIYVADN